MKGGNLSLLLECFWCYQEKPSRSRSCFKRELTTALAFAKWLTQAITTLTPTMAIRKFGCVMVLRAFIINIQKEFKNIPDTVPGNLTLVHLKICDWLSMFLGALNILISFEMPLKFSNAFICFIFNCIILVPCLVPWAILEGRTGDKCYVIIFHISVIGKCY